MRGIQLAAPEGYSVKFDAPASTVPGSLYTYPYLLVSIIAINENRTIVLAWLSNQPMARDGNGLEILITPRVFSGYADSDLPATPSCPPLMEEVHSRKIHAEVPLAEGQLVVLVSPPQVGDVQFIGRGGPLVAGFTTLFYEPEDERINVYRRFRFLFSFLYLLRFNGGVFSGFALLPRAHFGAGDGRVVGLWCGACVLTRSGFN